MTDEERIQILETELHRLAGQLAEQQAEIGQLRQQMKNLSVAAARPDLLQSTLAAPLQHASLESLIGLRLIHLIGIVVLVIGLSLGVKYAIDKNLISEAARIGLAYAAGALLLFLSLRLKKQYAGFSAILFSGAMASVYFTTYGAFVYYSLLAYPVAFAMMIVFTFLTAYQALMYNREEIALLGLVGAYGIPFLISPNRGHNEVLFLYITVINCGVVFLGAKKPWRMMGRTAQYISWLLFIGWASWQPDAGLKTFGPVFMTVFFVLFAVNALSPKLFRGKALSNSSIYQYLINNLLLCIAAVLLFASSVSNTQLAAISLLMALFTSAQAAGFWYGKERTAGVLTSYAALLCFIVFIGFQWTGLTVTLLWLLTAVGLFIAGVKTGSTRFRMTSIVLMGLTLLKLVALDSLRFSTLQKVIAYLVLGVLLLLVSFFYQKTRASSER